MRGEPNKVVHFCAGAPSWHWAKVATAALDSERRRTIAGMRQKDPESAYACQ